MANWYCTDVYGKKVANGSEFIPGPDSCLVCKCETGKSKFCRAVLCQPPHNCRSFSLGKSCCDFICVDDMLPDHPSDLGLRMVASAVTAILSLALLLFLIHRLRQRKIRAAQQQQFYEEQAEANIEPCTNNTCCHNAAYCNGNDHVDVFLDGHTPPYSPWKPPSYYYPHNDAPPPYSEAIASTSSSYQCTTSGGQLARNPYSILGPTSMLRYNTSSQETSFTQRNPLQGSTIPRTVASQPLGSQDSIGLYLYRTNVRSHSSRPSMYETVLLDNELSNAIAQRAASQNSQMPDNTCQTLRSDEVYEDKNSEIYSTVAESLQCQPLNDLNRETQSQEFLPAVPDVCCQDSESKCDVCTNVASDRCMESQCSTSSVLPKNRAIPRPTKTRLTNKEQRKSTITDFQLRLSLDMSDSSTTCSDDPTRSSSSTSEDSTSIENSEIP